jgi:hypothetical protein
MECSYRLLKPKRPFKRVYKAILSAWTRRLKVAGVLRLTLEAKMPVEWAPTASLSAWTRRLELAGVL